MICILGPQAKELCPDLVYPSSDEDDTREKMKSMRGLSLKYVITTLMEYCFLRRKREEEETERDYKIQLETNQGSK